MKKIISALLAIIVMVGISTLFTSCDKNNNTDHYSFSTNFHVNSDCDFSAIDPVYEQYRDWRGECRNVSKSQAKAKWAEAEAAFKAVESKLVAAEGCFYEIKMVRYSDINGTYTPVETIGVWRFPAK